MRQDHIINLLFWIACSVPTSAPLFTRRNLAKVYHVGELHNGCDVAASSWFLVCTVAATIRRADPVVLVISFCLISLLLGIIAIVHPLSVRAPIAASNSSSDSRDVHLLHSSGYSQSSSPIAPVAGLLPVKHCCTPLQLDSCSHDIQCYPSLAQTPQNYRVTRIFI